jgi:hypothetical protein
VAGGRGVPAREGTARGSGGGAGATTGWPDLVGERSLLSVTFRGKTCFLDNTLLFKLLASLSQRPNAYLSYEDLLSNVWEGVRSDATVRSVVKALRQRLRGAGPGELADAIDGTVAGHYALKVEPKRCLFTQRRHRFPPRHATAPGQNRIRWWLR